MRRLFALALLVALTALGCMPREGGLHQPPVGGSNEVGLGPVTVHVPSMPTRIGVVVLHSLGHNDTEPVRQGWSDASDRYGFVAIYPSRGDSWNAGQCCGSAMAAGRDDVAWLASVIDDARRRYGLATVYLAGFSNGGMMAERLVAERPDVSNRFVTWGAAPEMPHPGRWTGTGILYSGNHDETVPATGGTRVLDGRPTFIRASATTAWWLPGSHLQWFVVPGAQHEPPPDWPALAWGALTAAPGAAPSGPTATG